MKTVTTKTRQGPLLRVFSLLLAALLLMGVFSPFALFAEGDFLLDGTGDARYELEEGELAGAAGTADKIPGYSGSGYVTGFQNGGDSVTFDVNVAEGGIYGLSLRSALYMENLALGKSATFSHTQQPGNVTDGNPERGSYWGSGQPVTAENPKWVSLDLGQVIPVHMVRVRVVTDWGARWQEFSVEGSLDNENFFTLKDTERYQFTPKGKGNLAGNYVDAVFDPAEVRYIRLVFTAISDTTGANGAQVGEFEVYSPVRTAELYLDGDKIDTFTLDVDEKNIVDAAWDDRFPSFTDKEIGSLLLSPGKHSISLCFGGNFSGDLNLDSLTFRLLYALDDEELNRVIDAISALKPLWQLTLRDRDAVDAAIEAYNALTDLQKSLLPAAHLEKLKESARRLTLIGESAAIGELVCYDATNAGGWSVVTGLTIGSISHSDRTFTVSSLPPELIGCDWIRPAMESKRWNAGDTLVSFKVFADTRLFVAWDSSTPIPVWLTAEGFTLTDMTLSVDNIDKTIFQLYQKEVEEGEEIALGPLGRDKATYLVLLEHFTTQPEAAPPEDTTEYPVLDRIVINDEENASLWQVESSLNTGDAAYSDKDARFTEIPAFLEGCRWLKPAAASGRYAGDALVTLTVNRDGWLYLAVPEAADTAFLADFEETVATLKTDETTYRLYRRYVDAGSEITLPAQNQESDCYIPIMKTNSISDSPDRPAISRFMAPFDTDGWYFVRENLDVDSRLFSNADTVVTSLPERYRGCDYIETYRDDKKAVYFYAEREIEVAVTVDRRLSPTPSWLMLWEKCSEGITASDMSSSSERSYDIYTYRYSAGTFVTVPMLADTSYDNYIVILKPVDEGKTVPENPIPEKGEDQPYESPYSYHINEVFNEGLLPEGFTLTGGRVDFVAKNEAKPIDYAFRRPYTYSSATGENFGNATDGLVDTYWEAAAGESESWLAVSFGRERTVDRLTLKVRPTWGARVQAFSVEGSLDGESWFEILPNADYEFHPDRQNTVTITLPAPVETSYIRLSFTKNTGAPGAQVSELSVYGDEADGIDRYLTLKKTGEVPAILACPLKGLPNGPLILEFEASASAPDREMRIALLNTAGKEIFVLLFDKDGFLKVTDGDGFRNVGYYKPDCFYTIKLVLDPATGSCEFWLDHLKKADDLTLAAGGAAERLTFTVAEDGAALSLDNLRLLDNPERYLFTENFDDGILDEGWSFTRPALAGIADIPFESDKSLTLAAEDTAAKAIRRLPAMSGHFAFSVKVRVTGIGFAALPLLTDSENRVAAGVAFYHNNLYAVNGDNWVKVMDGESPWAHYPADNWYHIRLVVNTYTGRYDLYVDGALRMKDLAFAEPVDEVDRVTFTLATENRAYIDSLSLIEGDGMTSVLDDADRVINVKDAPYGAKGDGVTDDTEAIQRALDDAAFTGRTVLLENGVFLTSTLQVKSDTTLFVAPTARILGQMAKTWYPLIESCEGLINYRQIGRGLILTENASNLRIEGGGFIDGNGFYGYRVNDPAASRRLSDARPCVILSILSENVTIQNLNLVNSAFWTLVPMESRNVTLRGLNVNSMNTPNRDGIDPCDVINCTIENCNILAGDDGLCFKSSSLFGCANIDVRNLTIQSRSNGIKFGSDTYGSLKNLSVSDITMKNVVKSGLTMQSADGAEIEQLSFERITMSEVDDAIFLSVGDRGRQPVSNPGKRVGYIRDVVFRDISFVKAMMPPHSYDSNVHEVLLIGLNDEHKIENVLFENVYLEMPGGFTTVPGWPNGVGGGYPEHYSAGGASNAWAYCLKYADNVTFVNCKNVLMNEDARPEITYYEGYSDKPALYDRPLSYLLPTRLTVEPGTAAGELPLPERVAAVAGFDEIVYVPVTWKPVESYDPTKTGVYRFVGSLTLPEGLSNPESLTASATVTVAGDFAVIELVKSLSPITVPYGTPAAELNLPESVEVTLTDGSKKVVAVLWNTASYKPDTAGTYSIPGKLDVPLEENPGGIAPTLTVTVEAAPTVEEITAPDPITLPVGTPVSTLSLPKTVEITLSDGSKKTVDVTWDTSSYRPTAGEYRLTGRLALSAVQNPEGLTVTLLVKVEKEPVNTVTDIQAPEALEVPLGTPLGNLSLPETVEVTLSDGSKKTVKVTWGTTSYRPDTVGEYTFVGTPALSEEENPQGLTVTMKVIVTEKETPPTSTPEETDPETPVDTDPVTPGTDPETPGTEAPGSEGEEKESGLSTAAKVLIGVGAALLVAGAAATVSILLIRRRKKK